MLTTTHELIDMVVERLERKSGPLGIKYVGAYDENLIPEYPAVVVLPGPRVKDLHGLHTYQVVMQLNMYVYHATLTLTKRTRSRADEVLAARIEAELDSDLQWREESGSPRVIHAYVSGEEPGVLQPRSNKSNMVICTRLTWRALSQRRF